MKIPALIAFVLVLVMVSLNLYPSWSQYARTLEEPLLLGCLVSIIWAFISRSFKALNRNVKVYINVKVKQLDMLSALFFSLVLVFPVTHSAKWIEVFHFVFTALAIIVTYINLVLQQSEKMIKLATKISFVFGFVAFMLGLFTNLYNVGIGELIVSVPILIHLLK